MASGIFITGTDTGVGKTYVTTMLLRELRRQRVNAAGFKPIACGDGGRGDAKKYWDLMNQEIPLDIVNPIYLKKPLAPNVAARLEHKRINLKKVTHSLTCLAARYDVILVEGAGGLLVPIAKDFYVSDMARDIGFPIIVVSRLSLGTINHSLLTVREAQRSGLQVAGMVLNDMLCRKHGVAEKTNIREVPRLCKVPLLGVVPHRRIGDRAVAQTVSRILFAHTGVFK